MTKLIVAVLSLLVLAIGIYFARPLLIGGGPDQVVAKFNGGEIRRAELDAVVALEADVPKEVLHQMRLTALNQMVRRRIVEQQAARQKATVDRLMDEVTKNVTLTDEEFTNELKNHSVDARKMPKEKMSQARTRLLHRKEMERVDQYTTDLIQKADVHLYLD